MSMLTLLLATTVNFTVQTAVHPDDFKSYDTAKTRERFVMEKVMAPDEINVTYTMYDRLVYGGAMPVEKELTLDTFEELKAEHFLDRRELGVINVGGPGTVTVDGEKYDLEFKEALYVGCGKKDVKFASKDKANPAKFYLNSAPAYKEFVTQRITSDQNCKKPGYTIGNYIKAGKMEESNDRVINQLIVNPVLTKVPGGGVNQLQMGLHGGVFLLQRPRRPGDLPPDGPPAGAASRVAAQRTGDHRARVVCPFRRGHLELHVHLGHGRREPQLRRHGQGWRDRHAVAAPLFAVRAIDAR